MIMLKKIFLSVLVGLLSSVILVAQHTDRVILKNGSIIQGTIVKAVPDGAVTINDRAGNTWVYAMTEVKEIEKTEGQELPMHMRISDGWVNMTTIGFLAGSQSSEYIAPFSMQTSFGYRTPGGIYSGMIAGIEFLNINHVPVMIDFQYALRDGDVVPVVMARGGYALPTRSESEYYGSTFTYRGGVTGAVGMGLKIGSRENFAWDVSLLYRYMQINYTEHYEYQASEHSYKDIYNRLELRVGFMFNTGR